MRYNDIIENETIEQENELFLKQALGLVVSQCQDFLKMSGGNMLWRGLDSRQPVLQKIIRQDRKPKDSSGDFNEFYNDFFQTKGFVTNRNNCIYASGKSSVASSYGNVYAIFPYDGFHFLWSPKISDMFGSFEDGGMYGDGHETDWDTISAVLNKADYQEDSSLQLAIESHNEIMISGSGYVAVNRDYFVDHQIWDIFYEELKPFM